MGVLIYFFYVYGYNMPDEAGCWVGDLPVVGTRVVATAETEPLTGISLNNAVDVGGQFQLWFRMGFYYYCVNAAILIFATIGLLINNAGLAKCGQGLGCCSCIFTLVWMILGSIWRWGPDGTLASCYKLMCKNPATDAVLFEKPEDALGSGYQYKSGRFMNIMLWILYGPLILCCGCTVICLPLCCICAMCGKK